MALRVLLADESSTIKKVMQLALQDYAVEVKAVPVGLDVLAVCKTFKPDIVFADVLLTKRDGYDVCADLKKDPETQATPVVLMWSGFMELDEARATQSKADRRLEKPFDADTLRNIVKDLVVKTKNNPIGDFLTFPRLPDFVENKAAVSPLAATTEPLPVFASVTPAVDNIYAIPEESTNSGYSLEVDELEIPSDEEFSQVPLTSQTLQPHAHSDDGEWAHQDLTKFKIKIPEIDAEQAESDDFAAKYVIPQDDLSPSHIESSGQFEELSFASPASEKRSAPLSPPKPPPVAPPSAQKPLAGASSLNAGSAASSPAPAKNKDESVKTQSQVDINPDLVEKILREEARELIESICWKVLPDIAERIVREEIQKILHDQESR